MGLWKRAVTAQAAQRRTGEDPVLSRLLRLRLETHARPWVLDMLTVLAVTAISLPGLHSGRGPFGADGDTAAAPSGVLLALTVALALPLWWRRRAPAITYFVVTTLSLVQWAVGIWPQAGPSSLVALYSLALYGSLRILAWAAALMVVEMSLAVYVLMPIEQPLTGLFLLLGTATAGIALGLIVRTQRLYLAALEDRAARLETERDQRVRLTAAAERSRVAREMHDIIGHSISVMVGLADGAAALAAGRNERSAESLRLIGDTGRQAVGELNRVLGVLRDGHEKAELDPQPGIRDLDSLLGRLRSAGLSVTYTTEGDLDEQSGGVQLTVYRIVQEALTNTIKHVGTRSAAQVTVTAEGGKVRVQVTDTGPPSDAPPRRKPGSDPDPGLGSGHGLIGIRQRASMYGGTVTIGPRERSNGWIVDVLLDPSSASGVPRGEDVL